MQRIHSGIVNFQLSRTFTYAVMVIMTGIIYPQMAGAQVYLKTSYIGRSKYHDAQTGSTDTKGGAQVISAGVQAPLSIKTDTVVRGVDTMALQTVWSIRADASYTQFNHQNMKAYDFPRQIRNYRAGIIYMRTLNKKWSLYTTLGAGLYTTSSGFSANQLIGEGAVVFIRTLRPNLKVGAGVAFDNTFGFPMVYPALFADWAVDGHGGKYFVRLNSNEIKGGIKYSEKFQLSLNIDVSGASVLNKDKMTVHLYYTAGITPEFKIGKRFSIPITVGTTLSRQLYTHRRSLTDFFSYMANNNASHFAPGLYLSAGIKYGL